MLKPSNGEGRSSPQWAPSSTRYKYVHPTPKAPVGLPENKGTDIANYKLPVTDVQTHRRNFPGYTDSQVFSLDDIRMGDNSGTTETDSKTSSTGSGGYTKINSRANSPKPGTRR